TRVGSIPDYLTTDKDAVLIFPKNTQAIVSSVMRMIKDKPFRQQLIFEARKLVKDNTLEVQASKIISLLKEHG
ncbi:MAG: hypothetical protein KAS04_06145, partial [Candidatus Aenigmarchaeota archaeon]|nr:hypothetical protein [Candidatus Aenigmarchaeota archaeon]